MKAELKAYLIEQGGNLVSDIIKTTMSRQVRTVTQKPTTTGVAPPILPSRTAESPPVTITIPKPIITPTKDVSGELGYRFECVMKHLGGASVLLREAYERANDEGIGEGTAEKIMEAMNEHSGMEEDIEKMLAIPDAKPIADRLLSGARSFRKAAWEAKLPTGGGTKEDIADARLWNAILYDEAYSMAKKKPGSSCVTEGM